MFSASTIFIYEFFTGGGCPPGEPLSGLATEALGMLWALLADFRHWGAVRTIAVLDPRFEKKVPGLNRKTLQADEVVCAIPGEHEKVYLSLLERCDAVLVLAPETGGILTRLSAQAEIAGKLLLGSSASAIAMAGDKAASNRLFRRAGLPAPETRTASFAYARRVAKQMGFPLVLKPLDGAGSEGVCRVDSLSNLPESLGIVRKATAHDRIVLQSLSIGVPISVSLLIANGRCLPLSLNRQLIEGGSPFQYRGSQVPFRHPAGAYALELACSAASRIQGLKGYVGVDLILEEEKPQLIEINPRLTTSYIGLRRVAQINLAQAIWEASKNGILPNRVPLAGSVVVKRDDPVSWGLNLHNPDR